DVEVTEGRKIPQAVGNRGELVVPDGEPFKPGEVDDPVRYLGQLVAANLELSEPSKRIRQPGQLVVVHPQGLQASEIRNPLRQLGESVAANPEVGEPSKSGHPVG